MRWTVLYAIPALLVALLVGCSGDDNGKVAKLGEVKELRANELAKVLKEQKGKVVLIDCWALWCDPCVRKFPHFVKVNKKYAEMGLVCISLNMDKYHADYYKKTEVEKFLKEHKASFPTYIVEPIKEQDDLERLIGQYFTIPYMILFDRNGKPVWSNDKGRLTDEQLDKLIETELAKDEPKETKEIDAVEVRAAELAKALQDQKGKVVLIDCWALWCASCVKKFPHFVETHKKYADKGLVCISLDMDKFNPDDYKRDAVLKFLQEKGAAFPNYVVEPKKDADALEKLIGDFSAMPYMTMFNRKGEKLWSSDDKRLTDEDLDRLIEAELAK